MLFLFVPPIVMVLAFLLRAIFGDRYDRLSSAVLTSIVLGVLSYIVFGLVIPGIASGMTEDWSYSEPKPVENLTAVALEDSGDVEISWNDENGAKQSRNTDDDYFSVVHTDDVDVPSVRDVCDLTPDVIAPYDIGSCRLQFMLPKSYVLALN